MKDSARYLKIVEWSDEDQCYVGSCPGVVGQCCHGDDEAAVYAELCVIVDEWIELFKRDGKPLPAATSGKKYSGKFLVRTAPELHQRLAIAAMQSGESLNKFCVRQFENGMQMYSIPDDLDPANDTSPIQEAA